MNADAKNFTTPREFVARNSYFFFLEPRDKYTYGPSDSLLTEKIGTIVDHFREILPEQWNEPSLRQAFEKLADGLSAQWDNGSDQTIDLVKASRASVQQFLRWALTGGRPGPTLMLTMSILGRDVSLKRIEDAAAVLEKMLSGTDDSSAPSKTGQSDTVGAFHS